MVVNYNATFEFFGSLIVFCNLPHCWYFVLGAKCLLRIEDINLVDPASSHMLVSKIKPCMSKYKHLYTVKLRTAHYISNYLFDGTLLHG
jgi:hypothetical protein